MTSRRGIPIPFGYVSNGSGLNPFITIFSFRPVLGRGQKFTIHISTDIMGKVLGPIWLCMLYSTRGSIRLRDYSTE